MWGVAVGDDSNIFILFGFKVVFVSLIVIYIRGGFEWRNNVGGRQFGGRGYSILRTVNAMARAFHVILS